MFLLKLLVLISATGTLLLRFISFRYVDSVGEAACAVMNNISIVCAVICLICALIWIVLIKKEQKKIKEKEDE